MAGSLSRFPLDVNSRQALVDEMENILNTDSEFARMATDYRNNVVMSDVMLWGGLTVAVTGSVLQIFAETENDRTIAWIIWGVGIFGELISGLIRSQGPEDLVNAYNDGRW